MTHILVVDNYDSFVYTLNGYLQQLGATTEVIRNDEWAVADLAQKIADYDGILVSPGPGNPGDALPNSLDVPAGRRGMFRVFRKCCTRAP